MFQPEAKHQFVRRYCNPKKGWNTFVDIDASEEGRTGGERTTDAARTRQQEMEEEAAKARVAMASLGVVVGGSRKDWFNSLREELPVSHIPVVPGDRDIVAVHPGRSLLLVGEVEGFSNSQPETKLYKAIGQTVIATSNVQPNGLTPIFVIVVVGESIAAHLRSATSLTKLGISGVSLAAHGESDEWCIKSESLTRLLELQ